ncbi:hypothetical protein BYT27DRAFT_7209622 [Phlegmacium glaucopus]|nr:hypothetical protein BYT27DRAFT_7209622 [Phlegmacium glaucopus]
MKIGLIYMTEDQPITSQKTGHPRTGQETCFLAGVRGITRMPARKDSSGWAFGISPEFQVGPARELVFWPAFGILPKYQPENKFSGWRSGYYQKPGRTGQETRFLASVRDITRIPARNLFSGWRSGYYPNSRNQVGPARKLVFWLAFGVLPEYQPETLFLAGRSGYHPNDRPENIFSGWCSGYYPKTSQKTRSGWAFGGSCALNGTV